MKSLILALTLSLAMAANAATSYVGNEEAGIVTPDIATGVLSSLHYTYMADGSGMAICLQDDRKSMGECKKWTKIQDAIPAGRKFVGFRMVSFGSGRQIEVYWK